MQTLKDGIRILSRAIEGEIGETELDWLEHFAKGLELLDDYDHEQLDGKGLTTRSANYPESADYEKIIETMRQILILQSSVKKKTAVFKVLSRKFQKGSAKKISIHP